MADNKIKVGLEITGDASGANSAVSGLRSTLNDLKSYLIGFFAVSSAVEFASDIIAVNREMESLKAQLKSVTQSAESAAIAFKQIQQFALDTPYEVKDLTETFISLRTFGIEPTNKVMLAITNQASKLGASTETLKGITLALGQAWAKGKLQGEEILQLVERGIPVWDILEKVTGKNAAQLQSMSEKGELGRETIQKLTEEMGEMASGANVEAVNTLNGAFSNLSDSVTTFYDNLMGSKSEGLLKGMIGQLTKYIGLADYIFNKDNRLGDTLGEIETTKARINSMQSNDDGSFGGNLVGLIDGLAGDSLDQQIAKLERLEKKKKELLDEHKASYEKEQVLIQKDAEMSAKRTALQLEQAPDADSKGGKGSKGSSDEIPFMDHFQAAAKKYEMPLGMLLGVAKTESNFRQFDGDGKPLMPKDRDENGKLISHATGVMQVIPYHHPKGDIDGVPLDKDRLRNDPAYNIDYGAQFLAFLYKKMNGDVRSTLAAYHGGIGAYKGQDHQNYAKTVMGNIPKDYSSYTRADSDRDSSLDKKYSDEFEQQKKQLESKLALAKNTTEAKFTIAENDIELALKKAEFSSKDAIGNLNRLKEQGKIGTNEYYAALTAEQEKAIKANIAAIQQKMALASQKFTADKAGAKPEDLPKIQADYKIQYDKYVQDTQELNNAILTIYETNNAALKKENDKARLDEINEIEKAALARLSIEKETAQLQLDAGEISNDQFLEKQQAFEDSRTAIVKAAIEQRRTLIGEDDLPAIAQSTAQGDQENARHGANTKGIENKKGAAKDDKFKSAMAPLTNALDQSVNGILTGQQKIATAAKNAAQSIALSYASAFIKTRIMAAAQWAWEAAGFAGMEAKKQALQKKGVVWEGLQWVAKKARLAGQWLWQVMGFGAKEAAITTTKVTSEGIQTIAQVTGDAARVTSTITSAATTKAVNSATAKSSLMDYAVTAASGAYASAAGIPYVGWILAPIAAIAAFAGVMAFGGSIGSAKGGEWSVGEDGSPYVLHEKESVLPAGVAENFRKVVGMVNGKVSGADQQSQIDTVNDLFTSGKIAKQLTLSAAALNVSSSSKNSANGMAREHVNAAKSKSDASGGNNSSVTHHNYNGIMLSPEDFFMQNSKTIVKAASKEHRNFNTGKKQ